MHFIFWFLTLTWKHYENSYCTYNNLRDLEKERIFLCLSVLIFTSKKSLKESENEKITSADNFTLLKYSIFVYYGKNEWKKPVQLTVITDQCSLFYLVS